MLFTELFDLGGRLIKSNLNVVLILLKASETLTKISYVLFVFDGLGIP
jgi:hypothetical protein